MTVRKITLKQLAKGMEGVQVDKDVRRKTQQRKRKGDSVSFLEALYKLEDPR